MPDLKARIEQVLVAHHLNPDSRLTSLVDDLATLWPQPDREELVRRLVCFLKKEEGPHDVRIIRNHQWEPSDELVALIMAWALGQSTPEPMPPQPGLAHQSCLTCGHCMDCPMCTRRPDA